MEATHQLIPEYSQDVYRDRMSALLKAHESVEGFEQRIKIFAAVFLSKPYVAPALGEGPEGLIDQHPLYRDDAFDCVTYVVTVLSLALSKSVEDFITQIQFFQYKNSNINYWCRHHFMELGFNEVLLHHHVLTDITKTFVDREGRSACEYSSETIDPAAWFAHHTGKNIYLLSVVGNIILETRLERLKKETRHLAKQNISLAYLSIDEFLLHAEHYKAQWPKVSLVEMVRMKWGMRKKIGTDMIISHTGWVIKEGNNLVLYHASSEKNQVVSVPLIDYLQSFQPHKTLKGLAVWGCH